MNSLHPPIPAPDCDTIRDLIPEYAFGLTSSEETRLVEAYVRDCPEASDQLADFRNLQADMRSGVQQIEPPTALAERLAAAIDSLAPVSAHRVPVRRQRLPVAWLVAAAAIMALITSNLYWLIRANNPEPASTESTEYANEPVTPGNVALVLSDTNVLRWVHLPPSQQNTKASAVLMWNAQSGIGLIYATNFPQLTSGTTYQLWLTNGTDRVSAGTFTVDQNGKGAMLFHITQSIDEYTWARITLEPITGSPAPTGSVVVVGALTT